MTSNGIVQKLWNYCNVLRDDGLSYGDYVEQLTFLLFLKMADEQTRPPFNRKALIPKDLDWASLVRRDGDPLETQGTLGIIFRKAQNKIQDPAHYRHILSELGKKTC
jgi:type I restriction enzyme M protein